LLSLGIIREFLPRIYDIGRFAKTPERPWVQSSQAEADVSQSGKGFARTVLKNKDLGRYRQVSS